MTETDWTFGGTWPYEPRFFETESGAIHYVDEGPATAPAVVFVHGNPTWSYLFRKLMGPLISNGHRVVGVDHLGFGRSDVPGGAEHYTVERHSERMTSVLDSLSLHDVTLVVHDWGGPIGLPWAARRPEEIRALFLLNTFAPHLPGPIGERISLRMLRSRLFGSLLVKSLDIPTEQFLLKAGTVHPEAFDKTVKQAYRAPHSDRRSRLPMLVFPREIPMKPEHPVAKLVNSATARLKSQLAAKPVTICWGMKDVLFGEEVLHQWQQLLPHADVHRISDAGHFVPEDAPSQVLQRLTDLVQAPAGANHQTEAGGGA